MIRKVVSIVFAAMLLAACSKAPTGNVQTSEPSATSATPPVVTSPVVVPTIGRPTGIASVTLPTTVRTSPTVPATPVPGPQRQAYLDDRSSPDELVRSLFNAVNQKQYARAYSYWSQNTQLPPFAQFEQGYAETASVQVRFGTITSEGAAGSIYYNVPALLVALTTAGATQMFVGCYTVRLPQPANFAAPPIHPMSIEKGSLKSVPAGTDPQPALDRACGNEPGAPITLKTPDPLDIGSGNYLDDRSTAESTLRSMFNAINLHQYVRAYSYWNNVPTRLPFDQFEKGYANTESVQLSIGNPVAGAAAGNLYWNVPVLLVAQTTAGHTQTFVGCYTLRLPQPALQATPPYHPLNIEKASVQQVANGADASRLMSQACAE